MTLSALIRKRSARNLATAISAIPATQPKEEPETVAKMATVAVANPGEEKTAPPAKVGTAEIAHPAPSVRAAHEVYLLHHWHCPTCRAAGQGYGSRCAEGVHLWSAYSDAVQRERADREAAKQAAPELPTPDPRLSWSHYTPATAEELERMVARVERAEAIGLSAREADAIADRLHLRDREGDDCRLCIECGWLRADATGWRCAAIRAPIPREWVATQLQRCPTFKGAEP
jgi:hypothetical protein